MKFFKRHLIGKAAMEHRWADAMRKYDRHFDVIKDQLPEAAVLLDKLSLHDCLVEPARWISRDQVEIELDWWRIVFVGVSCCELPATFPDEPDFVEAWLYHELDVSPKGFELRILLGQSEARVRARDAAIFDKLKKRWLINEHLVVLRSPGDTA